MISIIRNILGTSVKTAATNGQRIQSIPAERRYPSNRYVRSDSGIEFKSSMEANLYRFYTTVCSGLKCEYEPTIFYFPRKSRIQAKTYKGKIDPTNYLDIRAYVPDFRITCGKHVWYIEAKGVMDRQALEKARLLKRHYQWVRLYFVTINNYNLIKKHYSKRIRNWE